MGLKLWARGRQIRAAKSHFYIKHELLIKKEKNIAAAISAWPAKTN